MRALHLIARCLLVFSSVAAAAQTTVQLDASHVVASNFIGSDANASLWDVEHTATVPVSAARTNVTLKGQIVCPSGDLAGGRCNNNVYWMLYQLVSGPPRLTLTLTNLSGFNFAAQNAFGVLICGAGNSTALCTNLQPAVVAGFNLSASGGPNSLTFNVPSVSFSGAPFTFFVQVAAGNKPPIAAVAANDLPFPDYPYLYYLPHVLLGGGYVTKITGTATSPLGAKGQINFLSQDGHYVSEAPFQMFPGQLFRYQTDEDDRYYPATVTWAIVGSDQPLGINEILEYVPANSGEWTVANTIGFGPATPMTDFTIAEEVEPTPPGMAIGKTIGVAIANPAAVPCDVTVKLYDRYANFEAQTTLHIPAYGQITFDPQNSVTPIAAGYPNGNFIGSLMFTATQPVAVIALQDTYGPFASIPVFPGRAK